MSYFKPVIPLLYATVAFCAFSLPIDLFAQETPAAPPAPETPAAVATETARQVISAEPLPVSPGKYLSGRFAELEGDRKSAIRYAREALKQDPENKDMSLKLYRLLLLEGDMKGALDIARALKEKDQGGFAPEFLLATEKVHQGRLAEAQQLLSTPEDERVNALILPILQGWLKTGLKQIKQPYTFTDIGVDKESDNTPFAAYHLALLNDANGFKPEAEDFFDQALEGTKKVPYRIYEEAASFYLRNDRTTKAAALKARYQEQNPDVTMFSDIEPGKTSKVRTAAEGFAEVYYSLASVLYNANALQEEETFLRLALYLQPDFPPAQFLLANALEREEQYDDAMAIYRNIDQNSPFYMRGRIRTAYDLSLQGKREESLKLLSDTGSNKSASVDVLLTRGDILRNAERYSDAADAYSLAIHAIGKPKAQDWPVFYSRGICYERSNRWTKAEADFLKALELEPSQPDVLNYLGYSWLVMGKNIDKAKEFIAQAMEARPDDMHIIDSMGWALYITGDYDSAAEYLEQAVELAPNDPTVNEHLGDVYWRLGRKTEARYQWERALSFKPEPTAFKALHQKITNGLPPAIALSTKKDPQTAQEHQTLE